MSQYRLYMDYSKCIGCETCEQVCAFVHGKARIHMTRTVDGVMMPLYCQHCDSPQCVKACANDALYKDDSGAVRLNPLRCVYCRTRDCVTACPFGAVFITGPDQPIVKCDMCAKRRKQGMAPVCVVMCPCQAISYVDRESLSEVQTPESKKAFRKVIDHLKPPSTP